MHTPVPLFQAPSSVPDPADVHPNPTPSRRPAPASASSLPVSPANHARGSLSEKAFPSTRDHTGFLPPESPHPNAGFDVLSKIFRSVRPYTSFAEAARCSMPPAFRTQHSSPLPAHAKRFLCVRHSALRTGRCPLFRPRAVLPGIHMYVNRHFLRMPVVHRGYQSYLQGANAQSGRTRGHSNCLLP